MWHWARPADPRVPWPRTRRFVMDRTAAAAKSAAIDCFVSQTRPVGPDPADAAVLPPAVIARFTRPFEVFFTDEPAPSGSPAGRAAGAR